MIAQTSEWSPAAQMARRRQQWEESRAAAAGILNEYRMARPTIHRPDAVYVPHGVGAGPDYHLGTRTDLSYTHELARKLDRDDSIFGVALTRLIDNLLEDGFGHNARTGFDPLDDYLDDRWREHAADPRRIDAQGRYDHCQLTHLFVRSVFRDGDIFKMPHRGGLVALESHRCATPYEQLSNPDLSHGVELDQMRRHVAYWFTTADPEDRRGDNKFQRVPVIGPTGRPQVAQLVTPRRVGQTRGISLAATVADLLGIHDDLQYSKLLQAQAVSAVALVHQLASDAVPPTTEATDDELTVPYRDRNGQWREARDFVAGMEYYGHPGEKLEPFHANIPNPEFFPHVQLVLQIVSVNFGLPLQVLMLDPSQTNYSGWRGAMLEARKRFRVLQKWIATQHYATDYRWFIEWLIATDRDFQQLIDAYGFDLADPWGRQNDWLYRAEWLPPAFRYIDPQTEIEARRNELALGFTSHRRQFAEYGVNFYEIADEHLYDQSYRIRAAIAEAIAINDTFAGYPEHAITWRDLWEPPTVGNLSLTRQAAIAAPPAAAGSPQAARAAA